MVAEELFAADPSVTKEFNVGRISTIVGIKGVLALTDVKKILDYFENKQEDSLYS